jgi:hypothetical protein
MMRGRDCSPAGALSSSPCDGVWYSLRIKRVAHLPGNVLTTAYCSSVVSAGDFGRSLFPRFIRLWFLHGLWVFALVYLLIVPHIYENLSASSRMWSTLSLVLSGVV